MTKKITLIFLVLCIASSSCNNIGKKNKAQDEQPVAVTFETPEMVLKNIIEKSEQEYIDLLSLECQSMSDSELIDFLTQSAISHTFLLKKEIINRWETIKLASEILYNRNISTTNPDMYYKFVREVDSLYKDYFEFLGKTMNSAQLSLIDYPRFDSVILRN